ncbi:LAFE_0G10308g1_1 [Lachancea fermentati]|uniref:LAFE_0G10308g1_1 n=1 Tax=Lachancea fermentati TaxID=4955 RepID=A0A1G4MHQ6_LACFM|nr:LAFE_0G10308g1_1 [Lachancea fermentati]
MSYYPDREELPPLGALCLDYTDDIHRPPGDPLNELSFQFPIIHEMVENASLWNVVASEEYTEEFLQKFVNACDKLADRGALGIITSCGFLAQVQQRLAARIRIPIVTSSLLQIPFLLNVRHQSEHIGVITFDSSTLGDAHFRGAGVTPEMKERVSVIGCPPDGVLRGIIKNGDPYVHEDLEAEIVNCAEELLKIDPQVKVFLLECTQMPPSAKAIQKSTGLPVYDVVTLIDWFYAGLRPKTFVADEFKEEGLRRRLRSDQELKQ